MHPGRLDAVAEHVAGVIRERYPELAVPFHSRWRHFDVGGVDRWARLASTLHGADRATVARARIDLAVTSVLLDAGAGARWGYREPATGERFVRSEGLAVASLDLFASGALSADPKAPLRADAAALARADTALVGNAFQVDDDNPLVGLEGRAGLLRALGAELRRHPDLFGEGAPRLGNLYDHLAARAADGRLPAAEILAALLRGLGGIWPGRISLGGENLGDVWRHEAVRRDDASDRLVPFHKLSQWLAYSLVEPLEEAGLEVVDLDALTALAEYRNGGLLVDLEMIEPIDPAARTREHDPGDPVIVEWRALTVALVGRLAGPVRARLGVEAGDFPVVKLLEGGTWAAGRALAEKLREGGEPPLRVRSDGTVF